MQKGKTYSSGLGRTALILALGCALAQGRARAADSWERGMGGVMLPRRDHPAADGGTGGYLLAVVSAANPFSIPGLYESTAFVSVVRSRWSTGLDWERTGISGYSRDRLEISAGLALPGGFSHLTVIARTDSRRVTGYGREMVFSTGYSVSFEASSVVVVEMEAGARPDEGSAHATARVGNRGSYLVLTLGRGSRRENIARAGGMVRVAGRMSFLAGYDLETGEVSGGLMFRGPAQTAVSWSLHPVLGATYSISIGAVR